MNKVISIAWKLRIWSMQTICLQHRCVIVQRNRKPESNSNIKSEFYLQISRVSFNRRNLSTWKKKSLAENGKHLKAYTFTEAKAEQQSSKAKKPKSYFVLFICLDNVRVSCAHNFFHFSRSMLNFTGNPSNFF